jgi:hypothetical protein
VRASIVASNAPTARARAPAKSANLGTATTGAEPKACILQPTAPAAFRFATPGRFADVQTRRGASWIDGTRHAEWGGGAMKDLLFIAVTAGFFAIAWLYARSFEKL